MKAIGVKELKARLSEYLRVVRGGETLLVTDRTEVIAELRPASRRPGAPASMDDALDALADAGEITRARVAKASWTWQPKGLGLAAGAAREMLDGVRAERDETP